MRIFVLVAALFLYTFPAHAFMSAWQYECQPNRYDRFKNGKNVADPSIPQSKLYLSFTEVERYDDEGYKKKNHDLIWFRADEMVMNQYKNQYGGWYVNYPDVDVRAGTVQHTFYLIDHPNNNWETGTVLYTIVNAFTVTQYKYTCRVFKK